MAIERTFSMIKPDATKRNLTGAITKIFEENGLRVVASEARLDEHARSRRLRRSQGTPVLRRTG